MSNSSKVWINGGVIVLLILSGNLCGQNIENIGKGKAFGVSGGIQANNVFYQANQMDGRRDPFSYFLSGNLNLSFYDWSVPVSFSYSNQNRSFQQPFNQYGLSPTYKWLTLHAGYRSMMLSNYTVNGHLFLGGGFDITPYKKLKISGFYGRLQKAVREDTTQQNNTPVFERRGGGVKVTLGDQKNFIDFIFFKAKDDTSSHSVIPMGTDLKPEENLVLGFGFGTLLMEKLTLKGEIASSAITKDTRSENGSSHGFYDRISFAFQPRVSSSYYQSYKSTLQYSLKNMGIGLAYERVDPGYRTLGAYYFNSDLESFSFTNSAVLFQKKIRLNSQFGIQRNNLKDDELNTMKRFSGSFSLNYLILPRLVYNLSYSNFQTVINFRSQFDHLNQGSPYENYDTLNFRQIAQNANMNISYVVNATKDRYQNINLNLAIQKTADVQASLDQPSGAMFYNINSSYTLVFNEKQVTINIAGNANFLRSLESDNKIFGPTVSFRKTLIERKVSANVSYSYNRAVTDDKLNAIVSNLRLAANYTLLEKHRFDLNITQVHRNSQNLESKKSFSEITVQAGYSYNFSIN